MGIARRRGRRLLRDDVWMRIEVTIDYRLHLDLLVADVDGEVARLRALGATLLTPAAREEFGQRWFVLADPEGNQFCVAADA